MCVSLPSPVHRGPDHTARRAQELESLTPLVLHVCRRFAHSEPEAAELCQDALLTAWKRRDDWDQIDHFQSWVCAIARNLGRNARRKAREVWLDPDLPEPCSSAPLPDARVVAQREIEAVRTALAELPELERTVVQLRYADHHTAGHIDQALGLSGSGSRAVLQRGRRRLRRLLADHSPEGARLAS